MKAWGRTSGGADAGILFLSDANAELSRALGLSIEGDVMVRTKRFSLIADDGVVTHYFSSAKESSDTWAPNVLAALWLEDGEEMERQTLVKGGEGMLSALWVIANM